MCGTKGCLPYDEGAEGNGQKSRQEDDGESSPAGFFFDSTHMLNLLCLNM